MRWPKSIWWLVQSMNNERGDFGAGGNEKEARRQEDIARQREQAQAELNSQLALLNPTSPEYTQLLSEGNALVARVAEEGDQQAQIRELGTRLVQQQNARIAAGGPAGALEERTDLAFRAFREAAQRVPFEEDVLRVLEGQEPQTAFGKQILTGLSPSDIEQELLNVLEGQAPTTPLGQIFSQEITRAARPRPEVGQPITDTVFEDALKLVEDRVNQEAAARGLLGGGLRLEQLGRAGTEAAIAEALRQDALRAEENRLAQEAFANTIGLFDTGRAIPANVRDFAASLFNVGEGLRERDIGVEAALRDIQLGRETNLTDILNRNIQTRLSDVSSLLQRQTSRAEDFTDFFTELEESDQRAVLQAAADVAVAAAGGQGGSSAFSVPQIGGTTQTAPVPQQGAPLTVDDLLAATRQPTGGTGGQAQLPSLTRQPQDEEELRRLLALLIQ